MEDFYKIKDGMTEQHKKHLLTLKKVYDEALLDHKKQEDIAKGRVNAELIKLEEVFDKLKIAQEDYEKTQKATANLKDEQTNLNKDKIDFETHKKLVEEGFKKDKEDITKDREELDKVEKENKARLTAKKDQLEQLSIDANAILAKNVGIVANIKKEQSILDDKSKDITKSTADLKDIQGKLIRDIKVFDEAQVQFGKDKSNFEKEKTEIRNIEVTFLNREKSITEREKNTTLREQKVDEREIASDLRNIELNKKEKRIKDLQTIYEANKK